MDYTLSVIMPALNEESCIAAAINEVVKSFQSLNIVGEIVVVNDGSTDRTGEIAKSHANKYPFITIITHDSPAGIGASYWEGVKLATGKIVTLIPGDAENDPYEIFRYIPLMDHVDIVVPFFYNREVRSASRRLLSKVYKAIINLSFGYLLNYMNGTVMYRKSILENVRLKSTGFFFQTELLIKTIRQGYLYAEVPYAIRNRESGRSKAVSLTSLLKVAYGYISTVYYVYITKPGKHQISTDSVTFTRKEQLAASSLSEAGHINES